MDKWTGEETLRLIDRYQVTYSHMVPTQFVRLLDLPEETRAGYDVSSLRNMIHGAAPCPQEIKHRMIDWWGDTIQEYYAATEGGGTVITAAEWKERPGSVGTAWPGSEIRIYDEDANLLPAGTIGTVYMQLMADFEYKGDSAKTKANRIENFFTVGDLGELDEDGYLFLRDRKSDMIISGGANIYPAEIEGELINHPAVQDVAVFGIPDPDWGEQIKAVIELHEGVEPSDELAAEILAWAATRMGKFKLPKSIDFAESLPREPNGKLIKRKLRALYWPTPVLTDLGFRQPRRTGVAPGGSATRTYARSRCAQSRGPRIMPVAMASSSATLSMPDQPLTHLIRAENQTAERAGDLLGPRPLAWALPPRAVDRMRVIVAEILPTARTAWARAHAPGSPGAARPTPARSWCRPSVAAA